MRKGQVPLANPRVMVRGTIRRLTLLDLGLLVRHRRGMWKDIAQFSKADLDAADRAYRGWARTQMKTNRFTGFIVDVGGQPVASGCVWIMQVQPRPNREGVPVRRTDLPAPRLRTNEGDAVVPRQPEASSTQSCLQENIAARPMTAPSRRARKPSNTTLIYEARTDACS